MTVCCVENCGLSTEDNVILFEFPTSRLLRRRWVDAINAGAGVRFADDARICINHFTNNDYEEVRGETRLKGRVVPTVFGDQQKSKEDEKDETSDSKDEISDSKDEMSNSKDDNGNNEISGNDERNRDKTDNEDEHSDNEDEHSDNEDEHSDNEDEHSDNEDEHSDNEQETSQSYSAKLKKYKRSHKIMKDLYKLVTKSIKQKMQDVRNSSKIYKDSQKSNNHNMKSENSGNNGGNNEQTNNKRSHSSDREEISGFPSPKSHRPSCSTATRASQTDVKSYPRLTTIPSPNGHRPSCSTATCASQTDVKSYPRLTTIPSPNGHRPSCSTATCASQTDVKSYPRLTTIPSPNGHRPSCSTATCASQTDVKSELPVARDIEELLTNYQIENRRTERQIAAMADEFISMQRESFIEMQVGQGIQEPPSNDCLMLLENMQVDVDPSLLLADEDCCEQIDLDDDDDNYDKTMKPQGATSKQDPISLITSSEEDDVIIQEPHIDTVEVSDETDEDDMPLVQLKPKKSPASYLKKISKKERKLKKKALEQLMLSQQKYHCYQCKFTTEDATEYKQHLETHSKVIQICQDCGFTTCSKSQLYRHRRKHKNEKKYKCPLCNYSARHNMSLIYHLKTHENVEKEVFTCEYCDFVTPVKSVAKNHTQSCVYNKCRRYECVVCHYTTNRRSDLKRHMKTVHKDADTTDEEFEEDA